MKTKILISLLVIFFISSCEKEEISSQLFENTISLKSTPPEFSKKLSKEDYELYSQEMFALAHEVVSYAESQEIYPHFLEWDYNTWETATTWYLWENHTNDFDTLMSTFTFYLDEWYSGSVSADLEPWQIDVLDLIETNLNGFEVDDFYVESLIYLDEVFDSVYALQGVPPTEMDQMLSSIMILKGSIEFVYENTDFTRGPWGWKKIAKCVAGTVGLGMGGGLAGIGVGATIVSAGIIATGPVGIVVTATVIGAVGGSLAGTVAGGCWD
jgi:hypothetical protein